MISPFINYTIFSNCTIAAGRQENKERKAETKSHMLYQLCTNRSNQCLQINNLITTKTNHLQKTKALSSILASKVKLQQCQRAKIIEQHHWIIFFLQSSSHPINFISKQNLFQNVNINPHSNQPQKNLETWCSNQKDKCTHSPSSCFYALRRCWAWRKLRLVNRECKHNTEVMRTQ